MAPLFSIITVTYNAAETLPATLASIKEQTCLQYEYIVMDGISKDNTLEFAKAAKIPNAIKERIDCTNISIILPIPKPGTNAKVKNI